MTMRTGVLKMSLIAVLLLSAHGVMADETATVSPSTDQIAGALRDLSQAVGREITTTTEAREVCNQGQYLTVCAEIGKKHKLYNAERAKEVDIVLEQLKGKIMEQLKACTTMECLVGVANSLSQKLVARDPKIAAKLNLTARKVEEHKEVLLAAKENGVSFEQCRELNTASASLDRLASCSHFIKDARVQRFVPEEKRAENENAQKMADFRAALASGTITCGDNTVGGCTKFCMMSRKANKETDDDGIPAVCREIAQKYFGPSSIQKLEQMHQIKRPAKPIEQKPASSSAPGFIYRLFDSFFH